jgi:hypothetical protein
MWLGGEDQETRLGYDGSGCSVKGKPRDFGAMDRVAVKLE